MARVIDAATAQRLRCPVLAEGANGPTTRNADRVFARVARDNVSERTAAMAIGVERARDAKAKHGLFP